MLLTQYQKYDKYGKKWDKLAQRNLQAIAEKLNEAKWKDTQRPRVRRLNAVDNCSENWFIYYMKSQSKPCKSSS